MKIVKSILAWLGITLIMAGLPVLLVATADVAVPDIDWADLGDVVRALLRPDDGSLVATVCKAAGWLCWAVLAATLVVEIAAMIGNRPAPQIRGLRIPLALSRGLVTAAFAVFATASLISITPSPEAVADTPAATVPSSPPSLPGFGIAEKAGTGQAEAVPAKKSAELISKVVKKGDTLSRIAKQELGDASKYPEIFRATKGKPQSTGHRITDPDMIWPGDVVFIPRENIGKPEEPSAQPGESAGEASEQTAAVPQQAQQTNDQVEDAKTELDAQVQTVSPATVDSAGPTAGVPEGFQVGESTQPVEISDEELREANESFDQLIVPGWLLAGLCGAGALLAGAGFLYWRSRQRSRQWMRRPGRMIAVTPVEATPVEQTVVVSGRPTGEIVESLDKTLRSLVSLRPDLPELLWADVSCEGWVRLGFVEPVASLPEPWKPETDGSWTCQTNECAPSEIVPAPWPQLVTVGATDDGVFKLVNLEALGVVSIRGDEDMAADMGRYVAAELSLMPWGEDVEVSMVGLGEELADMHPSRLKWANSAAPVDDALAHAVATYDALDTDEPLSLTAARSQSAADQLWQSKILITDTNVDRLDTLTALVADHPRRTATSVLLVGDTGGAAVRAEFHISSAGRLTVAALGLSLVANGITEDEAKAMAAFVRAGRDEDETDQTDAEIPSAEDTLDQPWHEMTNLAGQVRIDLALVRGSDLMNRLEAESLLPDEDDTYLARTANTPQDLNALAPMLPISVRDRIKATTATLDQDLADWANPGCARPKLRVLGEMKVVVGPTGEPSKPEILKRKGYFTELLALLASRPRGLMVAQIVDAMGAARDSDIRRDVGHLRGWLGADPATGKPYLPAAARNEEGKGVYKVHGLLTDADLFVQLRRRAEASGKEGHHDLVKALRLVEGAPYSNMRLGGGAWLVTGDRLDAVYTAAIVDVAHLVTTHAMIAGDLGLARWSAERAALAAPYDSRPKADLVEIAKAEKNFQEARSLAEEIAAFSPDGNPAPIDVPEGIKQIAVGHRWFQEQAS
ncbi:MAG: hypothetical protein LBI99_08765 [Propionibacteriaceae bacterium]|jgi:hypothetical protein|nr:hypothetical protein [Propionibacteriaceae bacterium]